MQRSNMLSYAEGIREMISQRNFVGKILNNFSLSASAILTVSLAKDRILVLSALKLRPQELDERLYNKLTQPSDFNVAVGLQ